MNTREVLATKQIEVMSDLRVSAERIANALEGIELALEELATYAEGLDPMTMTVADLVDADTRAVPPTAESDMDEQCVATLEHLLELEGRSGVPRFGKWGTRTSMAEWVAVSRERYPELSIIGSLMDMESWIGSQPPSKTYKSLSAFAGSWLRREATRASHKGPGGPGVPHKGGGTERQRVIVELRNGARTEMDRVPGERWAGTQYGWVNEAHYQHLDRNGFLPTDAEVA